MNWGCLQNEYNNKKLTIAFLSTYFPSRVRVRVKQLDLIGICVCVFNNVMFPGSPITKPSRRKE